MFPHVAEKAATNSKKAKQGHTKKYLLWEPDFGKRAALTAVLMLVLTFPTCTDVNFSVIKVDAMS